MASQLSLLDILRSKTTVDCDTLDAAVAESLGPFEDCTSNQAIAYAELLHTKHTDLIKTSVQQAKDLSSTYPDIKLEALAVEICMINLALLIAPHLKGLFHIQANPFDAYSTSRTITSARRIVALIDHLSPATPPSPSNPQSKPAKSRVCIKIPSTWEGLQACQVLEKEGIYTLATTLFSLEQAAVAAEAGCRYIAPYVNELAVHFVQGFIDPSPNHHVCVQSQLYFARHKYSTHTLPASLTSIEECMSLAGVSHITISPPLLRALAEFTVSDPATLSPSMSSLFTDAELTRKIEEALPNEKLDLIDDEERFRRLFTLRDAGSQEIKQVKAINVFAEMQVRLEKVVAEVL